MPDVRDSKIMRKIAHDVVDYAFPAGLSPEENEQLVNSVVRQWIGYEGHAGLITEERRYWITLRWTPKEGYDLGVTPISGTGIELFMRDWDFGEEQIPEIIWGLNVSQSAVVINRRGECLRMRIDPTKRSIEIERANLKGK